MSKGNQKRDRRGRFSSKGGGQPGLFGAAKALAGRSRKRGESEEGFSKRTGGDDYARASLGKKLAATGAVAAAGIAGGHLLSKGLSRGAKALAAAYAKRKKK